MCSHMCKIHEDYLKAFHDMLRVKDLDAASIVADNLISSLVDHIVFQDNPSEDSRIIREGVDAVYQYLIGSGSAKEL